MVGIQPWDHCFCGKVANSIAPGDILLFRAPLLDAIAERKLSRHITVQIYRVICILFVFNRVIVSNVLFFLRETANVGKKIEEEKNQKVLKGFTMMGKSLKEGTGKKTGINGKKIRKVHLEGKKIRLEQRVKMKEQEEKRKRKKKSTESARRIKKAEEKRRDLMM